jgi:hypothetical protein
MTIKPLAYINVEERKLEWAEPITWHTPTIAQMDKVPLYLVKEQNIDYKSSFDPATYNVENSATGDNDYFWSDYQVGRIWWDLDSVRFVDYQQKDRAYKINNWGKLFEGSQVKVYEWVESSVKPSQYVARGFSGIPRHSDDSFYTELVKVDPQTGLLKTKYYFWVSDKTTSATGKNVNLITIKNAIENPTQQSIPYAAVLDNNSLAL